MHKVTRQLYFHCGTSYPQYLDGPVTTSEPSHSLLFRDTRELRRPFGRRWVRRGGEGPRRDEGQTTRRVLTLTSPLRRVSGFSGHTPDPNHPLCLGRVGLDSSSQCFLSPSLQFRGVYRWVMKSLECTKIIHGPYETLWEPTWKNITVIYSTDFK